jgi:hypothetical protein
VALSIIPKMLLDDPLSLGPTSVMKSLAEALKKT